MKKILELYPAIQSEGSRSGMPTIIVRTTGCTHRCYFGEGGWCDSWTTSIHPEKGLYDLDDVIDMYREYNWIKEMMITGGSPTMHPELIDELVSFAKVNNIIVTIETEGSHYVETKYKIDLVSISPKFSNSIPEIGAVTPGGKKVSEDFIKQHNKFRLNKVAIRKMIDYHKDYHFKPVWNGTDSNLEEIEEFRIEMNIPKNKTWLMPAGDGRLRLIEMYPLVIKKCIEMGYNFCSREHIIAFDKERYV